MEFFWQQETCNKYFTNYHIHITVVPLPFNSADTIPCKFGSSPNQKTHNSFALLILSGSLFDRQPVEGLLRHAHKMSWLRADENDFNTGSSTGLAPHARLKTYFRHFKPHKSVCRKKEFLAGKKKSHFWKTWQWAFISRNVDWRFYPTAQKIFRSQCLTDHYLKKSPLYLSGKSWEFTLMYIS